MYSNEKKHFYCTLIDLDLGSDFSRLGSLCQLTLNLILYYSVYEAQDFELKDPIFSDIYRSCKIVHAWIHYHYLNNLLDMNDISAYLDQSLLNELPKFSEEEVTNYME